MRTIHLKQNKQSSVFAKYTSNNFGDQLTEFYRVYADGTQTTLGFVWRSEGDWLNIKRDFMFELKLILRKIRSN